MIVQSYGGGLNSVGVALLYMELGIKISLRMFANPGAEWPETYEHVDYMDEWLTERTGVGITHVREPRFTLESDCLSHQTMPSIVLGMRSCSDKFKIRPQNRFMRQWSEAQAEWKAGRKITKLVGFDVDEAHRIKDYDDTRYEVRYPLVEAGWSREDCEAACIRHGIPVPRKSSCFFCPEMQWQEIKELKESHPELLERALAMEAGNTKMLTAKGLARTISWKEALVHIESGEIDKLPRRMKRLPCTCAG